MHKYLAVLLFPLICSSATLTEGEYKIWFTIGDSVLHQEIRISNFAQCDVVDDRSYFDITITKWGTFNFPKARTVQVKGLIKEEGFYFIIPTADINGNQVYHFKGACHSDGDHLKGEGKVPELHQKGKDVEFEFELISLGNSELDWDINSESSTLRDIL
ncbi:MAG: hypothetical protein ACSHYA_06785 [Opitutaceae bacterium]